MRRLGEAPEATVAEQAKALGIRRSTAFAVAAGLEAMGLAERDSRGRLRAGPAAARLGLAFLALARWRMQLKRCFLCLGMTRTPACL
jgi:DNA-binding IclR family transcriptional regulator